MQDRLKNIGILGGTFDPVHYGHLIIAEEVREKFNLDMVVFIPTGMPPHKAQIKVSHVRHRFNMVCDAVNTNPYFEASSIEMERSGYTYTIDTLMKLKEIYGDDSRLHFIIGADIIWDLLTWKEYKKVFLMCEFIAVLRPGFKRDSLLGEVGRLKEVYAAKIHALDIPLIEISSTIIRQKARDGRSIKYLVPECVEAYINKNKLYSEAGGCDDEGTNQGQA